MMTDSEVGRVGNIPGSMTGLSHSVCHTSITNGSTSTASSGTCCWCMTKVAFVLTNGCFLREDHLRTTRPPICRRCSGSSPPNGGISKKDRPS